MEEAWAHTSLRLFSSREKKNSSEKVIRLQRARCNAQRKGCLKKYFSLSVLWGWWKGRCKCHGARDAGGQRGPETRVWWEMCASLCPQIQGGDSIRKTPGAMLVSPYPQPQKSFARNSSQWLTPWHALCPCASGWHREPLRVKPEHFVHPGGKEWAELVWEVNSHKTASRAGEPAPHCCLRVTSWHQGASCHPLPHGLAQWSGRTLAFPTGTTDPWTHHWHLICLPCVRQNSRLSPCLQVWLKLPAD